MDNFINEFLNKFGKSTKGISLPATNSIEENAKLMAIHYNDLIEPGHGLFIDFKNTPELEKPVLDYLKIHFGWIQEKPFFVRKPDFKHN